MEYKYVCKGDVEKNYIDGVSVMELSLDADFPDIQKNRIKFFRYNLKKGATVRPALNGQDLVVLAFNGKGAFVTCGKEVFMVTEPSFFIPDFASCAYTVGATEDCEFIYCVFGMNDSDRINYLGWHKHLPFFKKYSEGVAYDQPDCKIPGTESYSILQGGMLGHLTIGITKAIGAGTDEKGHPVVHQWNYVYGDSDFVMDVEGETSAQKAGDFSFIYGGKDHKLAAEPGKEVFYCWFEYYAIEDAKAISDMLVYNVTNQEYHDTIAKLLAEKA